MSKRAVVATAVGVCLLGFVGGSYLGANLPQRISIAFILAAIWFNVATLFRLGSQS